MKWRPNLITHALREHRTSALIWVVGGTIAMFFTGLSLAAEIQQYPGGPQALELSVMPAVESMRPIRWPAEHLDTLGGYLNYHNVVLVNFFLAVYAAVQGAKLIRSAEDQHVADLLLSTGVSRRALLAQRALSLSLLLLLISIGVGVGTGAAIEIAGWPNFTGAVTSLFAGGCAAVLGMALGLLFSQFTRTSRAAAGLSALVLTVMYIGNNISGMFAGTEWIKYVTPFYYANLSRALVEGFSANWGAIALLLGAAALLVAGSAALFERRDCGAPLMRRTAAARGQGFIAHGRFRSRSVYGSNLLRGWSGIVVWSLSTAGFTALLIGLEPTYIDFFNSSDFMRRIIEIYGVGNLEHQYLTMVGELILPFIAAYTVSQAATWATELQQGRVEWLLATPMSWTRLVLERVAAAVTGAVIVSAVALLPMLGFSWRLGLSIEWDGYGRLLAACALTAFAVAGLSAVVVALFRSRLAVMLLNAYIAAAYLLPYFVNSLSWPTWLNHTSLFYAFGHPYDAWPALGTFSLILVLAFPGVWLATAVAERSPKVA